MEHSEAEPTTANVDAHTERYAARDLWKELERTRRALKDKRLGKALVFSWGRADESAVGSNAQGSAMKVAIERARRRARAKMHAAIKAVNCSNGDCSRRWVKAIREEIISRDSGAEGTQGWAMAVCFSWAVTACPAHG